jgi:uncharacterized protein YecE (DUF72 family)
MSTPMVKVGCCGFGVARPKYFQEFSLVEIQQTFYQPPKPDTIKRWRDEAPSDFEFTMKAWQLITHEPSSPTYRRLKKALSEKEKNQIGAFRWTDSVRLAWGTTLQVAQLLKADKVIFQCPASFTPTSENKDRMRQFFSGIERSGTTCIWEPRGEWQKDEIVALCQELNLIHCVDPFKAECVTDGLHYYRLHGISGYHHKYTDNELYDLAQRFAGGTQTYFLFNNVSMWQDSARFKQLLK